MPLLRLAEFCKPLEQPQRLEVSLLSGTEFLRSVWDRRHEEEVCQDLRHISSPPYDYGSIALAPVDVFKSLSIFSGTVVRLTSEGGQCAFVHLFLEPNNKSSGSVFLSPVTASALGVCLWATQQADPCKGFVEIVSEEISHASKVVLRPLGRPHLPGCWPRFLSDERESASDDTKWPHPTKGQLLCRGSVCSVYDPRGKATFLYEVLNCDGQNSGIVPIGSFAKVVSLTKFELDGEPVSRKPSVRRLPPLSALQTWNEILAYSRNFQDIGVISVDSDATIHQVPPHPNLLQMSRYFLQPTTLDPEEKVIHIIGTQREHHANTCVEAAANEAGMRCLSINGLAAFASHAGKTITTGLVVDMLAGFQAVLEYVRSNRLEPCVVHLCNLDRELECVGKSSDDPSRLDFECRLWSAFVDALETDGQEEYFESDSQNDSLQKSPPMLLVFSTSDPLKNGPILQNLVVPTFEIDAPDRRYSEHIWNAATINESGHIRETFPGILVGRPAFEISQLRRMRDRSDSSVEELITEMDKSNQKKATGVRISNVRWEDVGGLAHVRDEIMDAIELPLKHPHLFPDGRGRSGVLLYGPPGTGKTLVAKAVATECQLPFLSVKGPELLGSYVGESEANIRSTFESARDAAIQNAPNTAAILFFDELDSLAPRRGDAGDGGGVMDRVVATLFAELDGPSTETSKHASAKVFVMGATNRPDLLDPSLLRPGRFDRLVYLGVAASAKDRAAVLAAQVRKLRLEDEAVTLAKLVADTLPPNLTGADLSTIASNAQMKSVQRLCDQVDEEVRISLERNGIKLSAERILEDWTDEECIPTVTLDDLMEASKQIVPSVSMTEIMRYEELRERFRRA